MITRRIDTPTGLCCSICEHAVVHPFGARPDEYLVCEACAAEHRTRVRVPVVEEIPDLSDSFWRIATGSTP